MNVLLVRSAEFAVTPALPRFAAVLASILPPGSVHALCWRTDPSVVTPFLCPQASVVHFERRINSRSILGALSLPLWWVRIWRELAARRHSIVQASDVFSLFPVLIARPFFRYSVVADVRDHLGSIAGTHWGWKAALLGKLERFLLTLSDKVVLVDDTRKELVPRRIVRTGKVVVVRNVPLEDVNGYEEPVRAGPVRLNYSGHLSPIRGAEMLLAAVVRADARLDVIGDIPDPDLRKRVERNPAVDRYARMSHADAMRRMKAADLVALLYDPRVIANRYAAPNKFYEAMMLARPVITCDGTPVADWAREHDCGWVVRYDDVDELIRIIRHVAESREEWRAKCVNARRLYEARFTWERESAALAAAYRELLGEFTFKTQDRARGRLDGG